MVQARAAGRDAARRVLNCFHDRNHPFNKTLFIHNITPEDLKDLIAGIGFLTAFLCDGARQGVKQDVSVSEKLLVRMTWIKKMYDDTAAYLKDIDDGLVADYRNVGPSGE